MNWNFAGAGTHGILAVISGLGEHVGSPLRRELLGGILSRDLLFGAATVLGKIRVAGKQYSAVLQFDRFNRTIRRQFVAR